MADKSGGDALQANAGVQGNLAGQAENVIGTGGVGAVDGLGGAGVAAGVASQVVGQGQSQGNIGITGAGGGDNTQADTNLNV